jgi:acetyltransferase EpsM
MEIVILGAGGYAQQIGWLVQRRGVDRVLGYVDETISEPTSTGGLPVRRTLAEIENLADKRPFHLIAGVGNQKTRKRWFEQYSRSYQFTTVVDPSVMVAPAVQIGNDVVILGNTICSVDAVIEDHVNINWFCLVTHHTRVGRYTNIASGVRLTGGATVGEFCELGTNAVVLPKVVIGNNVRVGAGSVVTSDLPDNVTAVGVPARIIKQNQRASEYGCPGPAMNEE